jgi:hypothetical protein
LKFEIIPGEITMTSHCILEHAPARF